jgi:hypothetical protein
MTIGVQAEASSEATVRIKLPWHFIVGALGALALFLFVLWSSVHRLTEKVGELEATVRAGNVIMTVLQQDVNLLKWRIETTEKKLAEQTAASIMRR